ncbi:cupin domain-containing protein [Nordella sp. HKS 07]|uniref:cupin domain-containing protein n=1 Tax=Nordella sp. HKS 07 TaxID=2712222 RepID=UPI0013E18E34|nr:cupin domain-containing protein [Nordella sp. HKS 07]QIG47000.1 cupin domain-containing protein [Nordella sp. HKS 07]
MIGRRANPVSFAMLALLVSGGALIAGFAALRPSGPIAMTNVVEESSAPSRTRETVISCEKLPHVPGKSITTTLVDFPPGIEVPRHRHAGSVTAYVLKGTLNSQLDSNPMGTFGPGGSWFEPPGTLHTYVGNPSATEPAQIMAIFVADSDCGKLTIFEDE